MNIIYFVPFLYPLFTSIYKYFTLDEWNVNMIGNVIRNYKQAISWHVLLSSTWIICCLIQSISSRKHPQIHKLFGRFTFVTFPAMIISCILMLFVSPHLVSGCADTYVQYLLTSCYLVWLITSVSYNYIVGIFKIISYQKSVKLHTVHMNRVIELSWHPLILRTFASFLYICCGINANIAISVSLVPAMIFANFLVRRRG